MATKTAILTSCSSSTTSLATKFHLSPKPSSYQSIIPPRTNPNHRFKLHAKLGGEDGKKKFITKEQEPEEVCKCIPCLQHRSATGVKLYHCIDEFGTNRYWQSAGEREGENPMKTPLPYIIIFGMSTPFIILAFGFLNGWIKVPIR